jgi:hypothetical protein
VRTMGCLYTAHAPARLRISSRLCISEASANKGPGYTPELALLGKRPRVWAPTALRRPCVLPEARPCLSGSRRADEIRAGFVIAPLHGQRQRTRSARTIEGLTGQRENRPIVRRLRAPDGISIAAH